MDVTELLVFMRDQSASDLHLSSGDPPMLRIHGEMTPLDLPPLSREELHRMIYDVMTDTQKKTFEERHELDFALRARRDRALPREHVPAAARRGRGVPHHPDRNQGARRAGAAAGARASSAMREKGLVLVTGPTGSGKSTTLAAMVDYINETRTRPHPHDRGPDRVRARLEDAAWSTSARSGPHTHSFANALRGALREDPDVILVGELRDLETIQLAITAAETGHLVFATLHTELRGQDRRPHHRRLPRRAAGADPRHALGVARWASSPRRCCQRATAGPGRRARGAGRRAGAAQPDPRGQDRARSCRSSRPARSTACRAMDQSPHDLVMRGRHHPRGGREEVDRTRSCSEADRARRQRRPAPRWGSRSRRQASRRPEPPVFRGDARCSRSEAARLDGRNSNASDLYLTADAPAAAPRGRRRYRPVARPPLVAGR